MTAVAPPPTEAPAATFEDLLAHPAKRAELVSGRIIVVAPSNSDHSERQTKIAAILEFFVSKCGLGKVYGETLVLRFPDGHGRSPDVSFFRTENLDRVHRAYADAPADLAVEIVSPGSIGTDRGEKFVEYEAAGFSEYLLVDPLRGTAELFRLHEGRYRLVEPDAEGRLRFASVAGLWLRSEWLLEGRSAYEVVSEVLASPLSA